MIDTDFGGFRGRIDGAGLLQEHAEKAVILNSRILWTFSAAFQETKDLRDLELANRAYEYFIAHFIDLEFGGVYWMLDHEGTPVDPKKQIYAQAFAIYALSEYHKVAPDTYALHFAQELFDLIEANAFDEVKNGYLEALDREWNRMDDVRLSDKDMNATKTMNTHLHVLEAYTNLYRIWPDERLAQQLRNLIQLMSTQFLDANGHYQLFFDDDWKLQSDAVSYGHDIEGSWLLFEAAEVLADNVLISEIKPIALKMLNASLEGLDSDGGLMNEMSNGHLDGDKHWWPQAEALVGLVNGWQMTGNSSYLDQVNQVWDFTQNHIITENQEWRWRVSRDQIPYTHEDICGPWKCPYHNGRAMLELIHRLPN